MAQITRLSIGLWQATRGNHVDSLSVKVAHLHGLGLWEPPSKRSALAIIQQLAYLQLDTISVTARAQDMVLHTRSTSYMEKAIWKEFNRQHKRVFEEFAHARCLLPIEHLPYYWAKVIRRRQKENEWTIYLDQPPVKQLMQQVEDAPITIRDLQLEVDSTGIIWDKPVKGVMNYLTTRGYLVPSRREAFTTIYYDLPDRALPIPDELPVWEEEFWFHIQTTLQATTLAPLHRLLQYKNMQRVLREDGVRVNPRKQLQDHLHQGDLVTLELDGTTYYHLPGFDVTDLPTIEPKDYHVVLLNPFDNVLISRESLEQQYGFNYRLECYTPQPQRIYGFYVLPILYGPDFVGRVDPKFDRKEQVFYWQQWFWEPGFIPSSLFWEQLAQAMTRLHRFHGVVSFDLGDLNSAYQTQLLPYLS